MGEQLSYLPSRSERTGVVRLGGSSRDEMNLAEFPLTVLSTRADPNVKTLQFRDRQRLKNGEILEREWLITGADKFGLPTATDDDVILGLMRLTMDHGFRERKIYFTRYELLRILHWTTEGRSYQRLTRSLDRLSGVRIRSTNAFYDNNTKSYQTCNFGIIDAYEINVERGKRSGRGGDGTSFFIWSEVLFDSFRAGFIKKLDLEFYFSLRSAVSRRLYRYLDKHFYYTPTLERPLTTLAFEKLGISRNYKYASSLRQQIEPGLRELVSSGFLSSYEFIGRGQDVMVRMVAATVNHLPPKVEHGRAGRDTDNRVPPVAARPAASSRLPEPAATLADALMQRGIGLRQAERVLSGRLEHELNYIREIIAYFDHLMATGDKKVSRSPAGFLFRAVSDPAKFTVPRAFMRREPSRATGPQFKPFREESQDSDQKRYRAFVEHEVERYRARMTPDQLGRLYGDIERKMSPLKTVLSPSRFKEALEGCVKEEIARAAGVAEYRAWLRGEGQGAHG